jgi:sugar O-acyltransferase (sialic acid O-acetyltransferase NeuD family)
MIFPGISRSPPPIRVVTPAPETKLPLLVLGGGGHARVLIETMRANGCSIMGIADPALAPTARGPGGAPVLGGDEILGGLKADEVLLVNGVGSVASMAARDDLYRRGRERGFRFASVIHASAIVSPSARLAEGVQLMAGAIVQCDAVVGANSIVNTGASIDHDCRIGESVHIAPGATLSGGVTVGDRTHIGTAAVVIQGVSIGCDCLVGAGAVVHRDLADNARLIGQR